MARTRGLKAGTSGGRRYPSRRNPVRRDTPPEVLHLRDSDEERVDNLDEIVVTEEEGKYAIVPYVEACHAIVPYVEREEADVVDVEERDQEPEADRQAESERVEREGPDVVEVEETDKEPEVERQAEPETREAEPETEDPGQCMQPLKFYFEHQKWMSICKIATRCDLKKTVSFIESKLSRRELNWFHRHEQFKHYFHMPRHENRMLMGMWMLLLRTAEIEKKKECWFVVNGVPIRYSLREHALLSGLDCNEYPLNYEESGSFSVVRRCFRRIKKIDIFHVREKLASMDGRGDDRLKIAILYFLATIIKGKSKLESGYIEPFLLRVVNDLDVCNTFQWGRFSFLNLMEVMGKLFERFAGNVQGTWTFPGFILPLEALAFEAIPELGKEFRKDVPGASTSCPRLCRRRFKKISTKGIPLGDIYEALGTTKDISCVLNPEPNEIPLLERMFAGNVDDKDDAIVDSWTRTLGGNSKGIWWEALYNKDVETRAEMEQEDEPTPEPTPEPAADAEVGESLEKRFEAFKANILDNLKNFQEEMKKTCEDQLNGMRQTLIDHIINQNSTREEGESSRHREMAEDEESPIVQLMKRPRLG